MNEQTAVAQAEAGGEFQTVSTKTNGSGTRHEATAAQSAGALVKPRTSNWEVTSHHERELGKVADQRFGLSGIACQNRIHPFRKLADAKGPQVHVEMQCSFFVNNGCATCTVRK